MSLFDTHVMNVGLYIGEHGRDYFENAAVGTYSSVNTEVENLTPLLTPLSAPSL